MVPLPGTVVPTRHVRGALLVASRAQLREAGLFAAYVEHLPEAARRELDGVIAASWVPLETAHAHYRAADALGLAEPAIVSCTRGSGEKVHQVFLATTFRLVRTAGLTPWTAAPAASRIWERVFDGGGIGLQKLGPKEGRLVIVAHSLLRHRYHRVGLRAHTELALGLCCLRGYVRETAHDPETGSMTLLLRWV